MGKGMKQDGISASEPERAGQELYLEPVYIFQRDREKKKSRNIWYLITEAVTKGTLSIVVSRPTA